MLVQSLKKELTKWLGDKTENNSLLNAFTICQKYTSLDFNLVIISFCSQKILRISTSTVWKIKKWNTAKVGYCKSYVKPRTGKVVWLPNNKAS